jgi:hypothetical protein
MHILRFLDGSGCFARVDLAGEKVQGQRELVVRRRHGAPSEPGETRSGQR